MGPTALLARLLGCVVVGCVLVARNSSAQCHDLLLEFGDLRILRRWLRLRAQRLPLDALDGLRLNAIVLLKLHVQRILHLREVPKGVLVVSAEATYKGRLMLRQAVEYGGHHHRIVVVIATPLELLVVLSELLDE